MTKKNTRSDSHKHIKATLCAAMCSVLTAMPAFATGEDNSAAAAGTTVWTKASEIMQDVYSQIISISTVTAVVCAAVALLLMNFSKNGKTVDDSRAWLKRIAITWAILICCTGNSGFYCTNGLCHGRSSRHKQYFQKLVPDVLRAASAADYERMVLEAVRQYGRGISR